jgi:hypothetical protein
MEVQRLMKLEFSQMSSQELRKYILANPTDNDAIEAAINRADPNSPLYPYPKTEEDLQTMQEILQERLALNQRDSA